MTAFVIDTNVAVAASGRADQASAGCVLRCIAALRDIRQNGVVVLDDGARILRQYMTNLSLSGQPGAGDVFMKWVWQHQAVVTRCEQVSITPLAEDPNDFEEFPRDDDLADFDRDDRVFVAVALASRRAPTILNATDSDWWESRDALSRNGVHVAFLCSELFEGN